MNTRRFILALNESGCFGLEVYEVNKQRCYRQRDVMRKLLTLGKESRCEEFTDYIRSNAVVIKTGGTLYFKEVDILKYMEKYPHE